MPQKVRIECARCEGVEAYDVERCILILWTKDDIGIISHDIDRCYDYLTAIEALIERHRHHLSKDHLLDGSEEHGKDS
jgi:hypothetical protein